MDSIPNLAQSIKTREEENNLSISIHKTAAAKNISRLQPKKKGKGKRKREDEEGATRQCQHLSSIMRNKDLTRIMCDAKAVSEHRFFNLLNKINSCS